MLMKIVTYVVIALLITALGAGAYFVFMVYMPMEKEYALMKSGMPAFEKATVELKRLKDRENREMAWINPAINALSAVLADEIKSGKAEVLSAGNRVVINIAEQALYMPGSHTFAKESPQLLAKLVTLLRGNELKGRMILVGNTTDAVLPQGKGKKKVLPRDARSLAADRSGALTKHLEKNGVEPDTLVSTAYTAKPPQIGFKLKDHKTFIFIENPPAAPVVASKHEPAPATKSTGTAPAAAAPQTQPKPIPIQPAQPKAH